MSDRAKLVEIKMNTIENRETTCVDFVFIDMQGFKVFGNGFMLKEFCLIDCNDNRYHAIVKSTYKFKKLTSFYQRQAKWLTEHFHGLTYDCGDISISEVIKQVFPKIKDKKVVVKGVEKVKWIKYIFEKCGVIDCYNIEDLNYDKNVFTNVQSYEKCEYHYKIYGWPECRCALSNALILRNVTLNNLKNES